MSVEGQLGAMEAKLDRVMQNVDEIFHKVNEQAETSAANGVRMEHAEGRLEKLEEQNETIKKRLWMIAGGLTVAAVVFNTVVRFL